MRITWGDHTPSVNIAGAITVLFGAKESLKRIFDSGNAAEIEIAVAGAEGREEAVDQEVPRGERKFFALGARNCKPGGKNVIVNAVNIILLDRVGSQVLLAS